MGNAGYVGSPGGAGSAGVCVALITLTAYCILHPARPSLLISPRTRLYPSPPVPATPSHSLPPHTPQTPYRDDRESDYYEARERARHLDERRYRTDRTDRDRSEIRDRDHSTHSRSREDDRGDRGRGQDRDSRDRDSYGRDRWADFHEGVKVEARYQGQGAWYAAKVLRVNTDRSVDVVFNDGEVGTGLHQSSVRRVVEGTAILLCVTVCCIAALLVYRACCARAAVHMSLCVCLCLCLLLQALPVHNHPHV